MDKKNKISGEQIKALVITIIIGVSILSLPSTTAMKLDNSGWIAIVICALVTIPFMVMIDKTVKLYPGKDFFEIIKEALGPIISKIFLIVFLVYLMFFLAYMHRSIAEIIRVYLLETTPAEIIIITMLLSISYIARGGIEDIARMALIIYPIIIGFTIFQLLVNLPNADLTNIFPLFNVNFKAIPKSVWSIFFSFAGYELLYFFLPYVENKQETLKYSLKGMLLVAVVYLIMFFVTLSQFGIKQLKREIWPGLAVIRGVDLPGYFLENLDGIVMATWIMVIFGTVAPALYASGVILSDLFKTKTHKIFIFPILPIVYIISLVPDNLFQLYEGFQNILNYFAIVSIIIMPTVIFIAAYVKKGRKKA